MQGQDSHTQEYESASKFEQSIYGKHTPYLHVSGTQSKPDQVLIYFDLLDRTTRGMLDDVGSDHLPVLITVNGFKKITKPDGTLREPTGRPIKLLMIC